MSDVRALFSAVIASNGAQESNGTTHYIEYLETYTETHKATDQYPTVTVPVDLKNGATYTVKVAYDKGWVSGIFSQQNSKE